MKRFFQSVITFIVGGIIFIGVPIVSWDPFSISGFFASAMRFGYVIAVLLLSAYAAFDIPQVGRIKSSGVKRIKRQHLAVIFLQVLSLGIVIIGPFCDNRELFIIKGPESIRLTGLILYICGFSLMHFSESYLGRQFSVEVTIQEDHTLITDGLFRYIRHPRYLGIIVFAAGIALIFRSWLALILWIFIIIVLLWRISDEEKLLLQEFSETWTDYTKKTWRLLPFVY